MAVRTRVDMMTVAFLLMMVMTSLMMVLGLSVIPFRNIPRPSLRM